MMGFRSLLPDYPGTELSLFKNCKVAWRVALCGSIYGDVCMERSNGLTVAVRFNGTRLVCLPNKIPEVYRKEKKGIEVHI